MKFMKFLPLFVLLGTLLGSGAALASTTTIRSLPDGGLIDGTVGTGQFDDYWTFTLGSSSDFSSFVSNRTFSGNVQLISSLTISLYKATLGSTVSNPLTYSLVKGGTSVYPTGFNFSDLNFSMLDAADYALKISGNAVGVVGGRYVGSLTTVELAPAVPEPETWVMLFVGTLLIGLQLHRKNALQNSMLIAA